MADTSITRRLSFGSRTFPIDKYLSGIDDSEVLGLHYIETQHSLPFTSKEDLQSQQELFSSLKYNYMQNNIMLKMHENIDATFDMTEIDEKLKRAKQIAKEEKKEQQKVDQEIRQVIAQIAQLQQKYQEMQLHLRNNLPPLNQSCDNQTGEFSDDKDTKVKCNTIETQTDIEFVEGADDDEDEEDGLENLDEALERGAQRMAFQRELTKQIAGQDHIERTDVQATIHMGKDKLSFELEDGRVELAGAYCDAAFSHGDILDYAAKMNDFSLLCYDMHARLRCRDAIAADVAQIHGATWDNAWQVNVPLPNGQSANLAVDPNYGTEFGKVKVVRWSALDDDSEGNAELRKSLEAIHGLPSSTLPQVAQLLSTTSPL